MLKTPSFGIYEIQKFLNLDHILVIGLINIIKGNVFFHLKIHNNEYRLSY